MVRPAERNGDNTRSCNFAAVTRDQLGSLGSSSSSSSLLQICPREQLPFVCRLNLLSPVSQLNYTHSLLALLLSGHPFDLDVKPPRLPCGPFSRCAALSYCPLPESPHPYYDRPSVLANYSSLLIVKPAAYLITYIYSVRRSGLVLCACAFPQRPWW
jgi:hypothetical protein